jgi:hypothetical protein
MYKIVIRLYKITIHIIRVEVKRKVSVSTHLSQLGREFL